MSETNIIENIQPLLNEISEIKKRHDEELDRIGGRFNIFRVCGVNHYENTHSKILAEFLNPKGSHGLKSKFLKSFIEMFCNSTLKQSFDFGGASVKTEHYIGNGRLDILIKDKKGRTLIIENKIHDQGRVGQVETYDNFAKKEYGKGNYQIFYLTLYGDKAPVQNEQNLEYDCISYKTDIIAWLDKCVETASDIPVVKETIVQYIKHVKYLTKQNMTTDEKKEFFGVLSRSKENLQSAQLISQAYNDFYTIASEHFNEMMKKFANDKDKGLTYHYEWGNEFNIQFYLTHPDWKEKCWIQFEPYKGDNYYGLKNDPQNPISEKAKKIIHERLKKSKEMDDIDETAKWPFFEKLRNLDMDIWIDDIVTGDEFFKECTEKIDSLLSAMKGIEF